MMVAKVKIENKEHKIITTNHAEQRMMERGIDKYVIAGEVVALGSKRLQRLQSQSEEAIIIDKQKGFSIVIAFYPSLIKIVTVIDKTNVFVKSNTAIEVI